MFLFFFSVKQKHTFCGFVHFWKQKNDNRKRKVNEQISQQSYGFGLIFLLISTHGQTAVTKCQAAWSWGWLAVTFFVCHGRHLLASTSDVSNNESPCFFWNYKVGNDHLLSLLLSEFFPRNSFQEYIKNCKERDNV